MSKISEVPAPPPARPRRRPAPLHVDTVLSLSRLDRRVMMKWLTPIAREDRDIANIVARLEVPAR